MKQSLNYNWRFIPSFNESYLKDIPSEAVEVNIPHTVKEVPYNYFSEKTYQFISTYEKVFDVENFNENRKYFLRFEGFMVKAEIFLNGNNLGEYVSIYVPVEIDVTKYISKSNNKLLVVLDSRENGDYPPFGFVLDYQTFGGIYREVFILSKPKTFLRDIFVNGDMDGNVNISYEIDGEDELSIEYLVTYLGEEIYRGSEKSFKIDNILRWNIDNPNLYELIIKTKLGKEEENYSVKFGFRNVEFKDTGFYLNRNKVKLIGLNRHQGYPTIGYAASKSLQEDDALVLKYEAGVNVVRTSHYPQSEHFLNKCDEIGLLVVNEIPGWQHIGKSEVWRNQCLKNTEMMVKEERNHPSLIAHGVRIDESIDDKELYQRTNEIAHKFDPYRQTIGVRNFKNSELLEDIYGYNDFVCDSQIIGLSNPKSIKTKGKPLLITEYMGHMYPVKGTSDQKEKIEVALRHAKVIDDNFKYENTSGAIGWCFVDYHTHGDFGSGDYICPHGVFDLYRNPKFSSYIYASQQDKIPVMKVLTSMKPGDVPEAVFSNIYVATNCDYIELYKDDELVDRFYPKRNKYKYMKHPPIFIDDIIGKTFNEPKFPKKSYGKIAKMFSYAAMYGFNHLPPKVTLYLAYMMFRYKIQYSDLVHYWNKYVGSWGGFAKTYTFKGYIDGKVVKTEVIGPSKSFDIVVEPSKTTLINEDTYDTLKIRVKHVDNNGTLLDYSSRIVNVETEGPIELIGEKSKVLLGGQTTVYIKSKNESGIGRITIKVDEFIKEIEVTVK